MCASSSFLASPPRPHSVISHRLVHHPMLTERGGRRVRSARHRALPAGRRLAYDARHRARLALVDTVLGGLGGDLWLCTGSTDHRYLPAHHAQVGCGHSPAGSSGTVLTAVLPLARGIRLRGVDVWLCQGQLAPPRAQWGH